MEDRSWWFFFLHSYTFIGKPLPLIVGSKQLTGRLENGWKKNLCFKVVRVPLNFEDEK